MFEKVNPSHPDKIADRIAGAIVDLAYEKEDNPKIAVEVLIGHGYCNIIIETSVVIDEDGICEAVRRIAGEEIEVVNIKQYAQDIRLAKNQSDEIRCGDNGIFCGMPITEEQSQGRYLAEQIYDKYKSDGKYIIDKKANRVIICQSNAGNELQMMFPTAKVNPLGFWTGGTDVDTGATNRKLGSDMGDAVTGGGLHGKDLSKADVSVNIYAHLKAQETGKPVRLSCAIGDKEIDGRPYSEIVEIARAYVQSVGGFESLADWGLI